MVSKRELRRWQRVFHRIGAEAQAIALKWYGTGKARKVVGRGAGGDSTVWLDKVLENIVIRHVRQEGNARLISEEAGLLEFGTPRVTIIADPLDGSNNAKLGIPLFAISLALAPLEATLGNIEYGYVRNLVTGQEYTGAIGSGAFLDDKRLGGSGRKGVVFLGMELSQLTPVLLKKSSRFMIAAGKVRSPGSIALDLCFVAQGAFDAVVDVRGRIRALDIAAPCLIVKEAGGVVSGFEGESLDYVRVDPKEKVCFIATGNRKMHGKLMKMLKPHVH